MRVRTGSWGKAQRRQRAARGTNNVRARGSNYQYPASSVTVAVMLFRAADGGVARTAGAGQGGPQAAGTGGDCRTVCKTPMLYRMACRADNTVRQWEDNNLQSYDSATKGSSALLAAQRLEALQSVRKHHAGAAG